jgi:hypothetical protein
MEGLGWSGTKSKKKLHDGWFGVIESGSYTDEKRQNKLQTSEDGGWMGGWMGRVKDR